MPKGAQSCRAPSEKLRTLLKLSQQRVRRWGYLLTNFHFSLVEGILKQGLTPWHSGRPCGGWACSGHQTKPSADAQLPAAEGHRHTQ